nr:hypothetical protein [Tanacetum cinerariifolium]
MTKKKTPIKADRGKGLNVLSEVALSDAAQLNDTTKRSKKDFHISHGANEEEEDNDDTQDDEGNDGDDDDDENIDEFTDKEDDEENKEDSNDGDKLYKDVNVNLRQEDLEMTNADQGGADQHNVLQELVFEQEEEDAHVTLTTVHDIQKTKGPMQSYSVSSDFTKKLLNFENISLADNEIASLMDTTVHHEEPSDQTSTLFTVPITVILITIPLPPHFINPLPQQTTKTPTPTASKVTIAFPALLDFASVFRFNDRVTNLERYLTEMKQVDQYTQAISLFPAIIDC